jgi:phosphohistidine phosphatase
VQILLWRHADAEDGAPDEARALTERGHQQAAAAAAWLRGRLPKRYRLLVSPARRAVQTAQALARDFEATPDVGLNTTAARILEAVSRCEQDEVVVVVGHQPTLGRVASTLLCGTASDMSFNKSAVWWFEREDDETELRAVYDPRIG